MFFEIVFRSIIKNKYLKEFEFIKEVYFSLSNKNYYVSVLVLLKTNRKKSQTENTNIFYYEHTQNIIYCLEIIKISLCITFFIYCFCYLILTLILNA